MGSVGVVVGKFYPPHVGHLHLIECGASQVEHLYILLCDHPAQSIPASDRKNWLVDACPENVTVVITPDDLPAENAPWAARALEVLPRPPDIAFTSEAWGPGWASLMGASHVMVDLARSSVPISASRIRSSFSDHFHFLVPAARAALATRVVLVGAESTGKSTMANALAREFGTVWAPEHGRWYWEGRRYLNDTPWSSEELLRIALAQSRLEDDLARVCHRRLLLADTDPLMTAVWHERYLGSSSDAIDALAAQRVPTLYCVCCPDFEWVQDGTRESEAFRREMHESIIHRAEASGAEVAYLRGSHELRLDDALEVIRPLMRVSPFA